MAEAAALFLGKAPQLLDEGSLAGDGALLTISSFKEQHERIRPAGAIGLVGHDGMGIPQKLADWLGDAASWEASRGKPRP